MDKVEAEIDNIIEATTNNLEHTDMSTSDNQYNDDKSTIDSQNIEVFNVALHQYLKIDEEIKVLLEAIKLRNKTKKVWLRL